MILVDIQYYPNQSSLDRIAFVRSFFLVVLVVILSIISALWLEFEEISLIKGGTWSIRHTSIFVLILIFDLFAQSLFEMSTFGRYFRVTTFGESHCQGVGCIVDGYDHYSFVCNCSNSHNSTNFQSLAFTSPPFSSFPLFLKKLIRFSLLFPLNRITILHDINLHSSPN